MNFLISEDRPGGKRQSQVTLNELSLLVSGLPVGVILPFIGETPPRGYLICDGSKFSPEMFPELFRLIGDTLPDLRDRTIIGVGKRPLRSIGGQEKHTLDASEIPAHTHSVLDPGHVHLCPGGRRGNIQSGSEMGHDVGDSNSQVATTGITIKESGGGAPHNNMQPFFVLNYIIKA